MPPPKDLPVLQLVLVFAEILKLFWVQACIIYIFTFIQLLPLKPTLGQIDEGHMNFHLFSVSARIPGTDGIQWSGTGGGSWSLIEFWLLGFISYLKALQPILQSLKYMFGMI